MFIKTTECERYWLDEEKGQELKAWLEKNATVLGLGCQGATEAREELTDGGGSPAEG